MQSPLASTSRAVLPSLRSVSRRSQTASIVLQHVQQSRAASTSTSSSSKTAKRNWMQKQMEGMERMENRKTKMPIKQDQDLPFALYVPPVKHGFSPFNGLENWLSFYVSRFYNWYQSRIAGRAEFGLVWRSGLKTTIQKQIVPLYKEICEAQASGNLLHLDNKIAQGLYRDLEAAQQKAARSGFRRDWRFHKMNKLGVICMRQVEFQKGQQVMQMTTRIDSMQSLETRDSAGRLVSGSHDKPERVVENYVFQKRLYEGPGAPWIGIKPIATMTPLQSIGSLDARFRETTTRKRKPTLTVV